MHTFLVVDLFSAARHSLNLLHLPGLTPNATAAISLSLLILLLGMRKGELPQYYYGKYSIVKWGPKNTFFGGCC